LRYHRILFLLLLILCATKPAPAQSTDATISGIVVDPSGRAIQDAKIEILNEATGVYYSCGTNNFGIYAMSILPPAQYRLQVSKSGFKTIIKPGVILNVQSAIAVNFTLPLGAVSESVTIEAGATPMNTADASISTVIDRKFVENIPLNGRSFQDLISMTAGVVTQSPQSNSQIGSSGDFSVNGQRTQSNFYTVDGVSGNINPGNGNVGSGGNGTIAAGTALGTTQSLISVDGLQEFRVESSTYSAEYGHGPGGQFVLVTRSGTNEPHGTAFDYLRNNYFDANNWFNDYLGKPTAPLRQNDFGGTFGAPIRIPWLYNGKDKTFFFASYEGLRLTQPQAASISYVPDTGLRMSAAPALQPFLNAYPVQNGSEAMVPCTAGAASSYPCPAGSPVGTLVNSGLAGFSEPYGLPASIDSTSVRVDHTFGPRLAAFFRFGGTPTSTSGRSLSVSTQSQLNTFTYTLGATSQLSSRTTNEFRLGYAATDARSVYNIDSFGGAEPIHATATAGIPISYATPELVFYLIFSGVGRSPLVVAPSLTGARNWDLTNELSVVLGRHRLELGLDFNRLKELRSAPSPFVEALYYSPLSLQTNQATLLYIGQYTNATPIFYNTGAFVQDEWRVSKRLSLSLGVRWEIDPAPRDQHGSDAYTLSGNVSSPESLTLAPRGTPLWNTYWYNLAPRAGAAWHLRSVHGEDTVLKVGAGIFDDTYNEAGALGFDGALGFSATQFYSGGSLPITSTQLNISPSVAPPYNYVYAFPSHLQVPFTWQWNTSLEQSFGKSQSMSVSYVGANGKRLISTQQVSLTALNPNFGTVYTFAGGITSNYQALQAKFQRTVSHGIQALASYTWSHSIDFGSTYSTYGVSRGNSDFDVRHNFSAGVSWELPTTKSDRMSSFLIRDWGLDGRLTARTGFPITLLGNELSDPSTGNYYYSGVNLVPGKPQYLSGAQYPGGRALNGGPAVPSGSAAFTLPSGTSEGNAPRNLVRGFAENQINLALRRAFPLRDHASIQFRAEAFNIFNHPNFGFVDPTLTDAQFGLATQTLNQSLGTLAQQYQQGGPRSMQFALKLTF